MTNTETRAIQLSEEQTMVKLSDALAAHGLAFDAINLVRAHIDLVLRPDDADALARRLLALASSQPTPEGEPDHYAIVHDAILAALKVESEESVDDAISAAYHAWEDLSDPVSQEGESDA